MSGLVLASGVTPLPHGSFAHRGSAVPRFHRYYDPIRQSRPHPAPCHRLVRVALRRRDLPCFGTLTIPLVPPPMRRSRHRLRCPVTFIGIHRPSPVREGLGCSFIPRPASRGKPCRRCSVRSSLRPQVSLALLTGRTGIASPEDFCLSLHPHRSPAVSVRHCYAAEPGNCCGGTCTRMVNAVTGCTPHTAYQEAFGRPHYAASGY